MNRARWKEIDDHFARALALPDEEQQRFVREVLVRDPELGSAVKDLLESAAEAEAVLGESAAVFAGPLLAALDDAEWDALHPGALVGGYRLVRELGRGDRSTIYLGEPAKARFGKRVAIKVVTRDMDTGEILARIHHEHGLLVALDHAGIARFYTGGATAGGLPYLVMELVEGQPLVAWCDGRQLDVPARLRLFLQVCTAVQHAHQHLVAHRDLEPSRILVADDGTVKVLAFGFGRLLRAENEAGPGRHFEPVTTATDVWSLGAVLHQLLAGRRPYAPDDRERPVAERRSRAKELSRMSDVARVAGESVARARSTSPDRLGARLRGDLDAIVARATEPDPAHRYQSASALADEIARHLDGRAVLARPASLGYRTGRFLRRQRMRLGIAAIVAVTVLTTAGVSGLRLARERNVARIEADQSRASVAYLLSRLGSADRADAPPDSGTVANLAARDAELTPTLERDSAALSRMPPPSGQPGAPRSAARGIVNRMNASDSAGAAVALGRQATVLRQSGKPAEAERALREALAIRLAGDGAGDLHVAQLQLELGDLLRASQRHPEAEALLRSSLQIRRRLASPRGAEVGQSLAGLAVVQCEQGRTSESDSLFAQASAIYRQLPTDANGLSPLETARAQCR